MKHLLKSFIPCSQTPIPLQHPSSDSEHSVRLHPQNFYGGTGSSAASQVPSFTAMPIPGIPRNHGHKQQQTFNAFDHQRVGSFRSRLKKQHPISCSEMIPEPLNNLSVPVVEVDKINQRGVEASAPFTSSSSAALQQQYNPVIIRNKSPTNEQLLLMQQRKKSSFEETNYTTYQYGMDKQTISKDMITSLTSANHTGGGGGNQVQSFVIVEANNGKNTSNDRADAHKSAFAQESTNSIHGGSGKKNSNKQKRFWHIGGNGSRSRSEGSNKSTKSFHSSKGSKSDSSKDSREVVDGECSKEAFSNPNTTNYLSVSYKSQD